MKNTEQLPSEGLENEYLQIHVVVLILLMSTEHENMLSLSLWI